MPNHRMVISSTQDRVREKRLYPFEVMDIVSYCTQRSHVSQVGVGEILFHHQVMSDDIDDIQDPRYHMMSRRSYF